MSDKIKDVMSFRDYIYDMGGSGIIYESECKEILEKWKNADWLFVDDYISPIVAELLVEVSDEHKHLYEKMMNVVMEVYNVLSVRKLYRPEQTKPTITRIK
jgi:hypothetical protein